VALAFSGGVDSTFLLTVAKEMLGDKVLAVIAKSPTYPEWECAEALDFVRQREIRFREIHSAEMDIPEFRSNPSNRCYYCKSELFQKIGEIAGREGMKVIADGTNADDIKDHRPGFKALQELNIRSPLKEVGLGKAEIRELSRQIGLPTWDKPSMACFASRFPYGNEITIEKLKMVASAEKYLKDLGLKGLRVRHHGNIARIEVKIEDFSRITTQDRKKIVLALKKIGYLYITLDLEGFRTGSMNEELKAIREIKKENI
jgi:uncharacterized protein